MGALDYGQVSAQNRRRSDRTDQGTLNRPITPGRPATDYALTLSIFARDQEAISLALDRLRYAAGMTYINDKPTGALMGQVAFGGGRASGTNDKTGSRLALQRWISGRFIRENYSPDTTWRYDYLE